jgi:hypothetical protein
LNLRTDLNKEEKALALKVCQEILEAFKASNYDKTNLQKKGIFSNLDTTQAEAAGGGGNDAMIENMDTENNNNIMDDNKDTEGFDIDDFLKAGGISVDDKEDDNKRISGDNEEIKEGENALP